MMLRHAQEAARAVVAQLEPFCRRIEVAGSVRRQAPEVRDLEIVCIPEVAKYLEFQAFVGSWPWQGPHTLTPSRSAPWTTTTPQSCRSGPQTPAGSACASRLTAQITSRCCRPPRPGSWPP